MKSFGRFLGSMFCATVGLAEAVASPTVDWWAVPAMSEVQRLPDAVPSDGTKDGTVRIVAARGEYEPGSFVVRASEDLGKASFSVEGLRNEKGDVFPAEKIDLKVVKVWYQNLNGWFSYFADDGFKLCPELLVNDEDLIRVDTEKKANYARLTYPDGRRGELWLNPPRQMNRRYLGNHHIGTQAFASMRPEFRDARTLQPVTLEKSVSKQFFLTVHVTDGTPAGLYRGSVAVKAKGGEWRIPVALRVLDFALPHALAYRNPKQDFYVASYDLYLHPTRIALLNGGDMDLAWKQLEAILADQAAHNQDMHWMYRYRTGEADTEHTLALMKKVGQRTDVIMGGVTFPSRDDGDATIAALGRRVSDYYDRTHGHHDVYGGWGDEPSCAWLVRNRKVFGNFQDQGLKFAIASQNGILWKCGYFFDWHNASRDPTDDEAPSKWNEMGAGAHCAWYAQQHVGAENPAFNRRQYGLGCWLTGYSAICNYAHHLGPYNDDTGVYKPMVFAYGTYDGVIDTLQWEGFREGIDDIRYATLLQALALEADRSDDIAVRHLGRKARLFFASFQRQRDDLNMARAEMVERILALRKALGARADALEIAAERPRPTARKPLPALSEPAPAKTAAKTLKEARLQAEKWMDRCDLANARAVYEDFLATRPPVWEVSAAKREIGRLHERFFDFAAARDCYLSQGFRLEAARVMDGRGDEGEAFARATRIAVFEDPKAGAGERLEAYLTLLSKGDEQAYAHLEEALKLSKGPQLAERLAAAFDDEHTSPVWQGDWRRARFVLDAIDRADAGNTNRIWTCGFSLSEAQTRLMTGDGSGARRAVERGLAFAKSGDKRAKARPEDVYALKMLRALMDCGQDRAALDAKIAETDANEGDGVVGRPRKAALDAVGSVFMCLGREETVRALSDFSRDKMVKRPTRTYVVPYSSRRVVGLGGWTDSAAVAHPEVAKMDRPFCGEDMSFAATDVGTGPRGEIGTDLDKRYARVPEWQAMTDDWGIHFRFDVFDPKADEIARGLVAAGTLEGYVAPGANTPHYCFLHDLTPGTFHVNNTAYDQKDHRRIDVRDRVTCREEIGYGEGRVSLYFAFSWDVFSTRIPRDGTVWDFEPCLWGRVANQTWNGLRSVHGRSSWGRLSFAMPKEARLSILRTRLVAERNRYEREKVTRGIHEGVLDHWSDPETGDAVFYNEVLKPLVGRLDAASKKVVGDLTDAEVAELGDAVLPDWHDLRFEVERLRAEYLIHQQTEESK